MTGARVPYRDEVWLTPDQMTGLMVDRRHDPTATRRQFLTVAGGVIGCVAVAPALTVRPAAATPAATGAAIGAVVGEAPVHQGKVKLEVPPLVENGNAVPLTVSVDSPMTEMEHVKSIHIFNEKNPQPYVASFHLGPRAGRADPACRFAEGHRDRAAQRRFPVVRQRRSDGDPCSLPRGLSEMKHALINLPAKAKRGEIVEIKTLVPHPMETGYRRDDNGNAIPREIIRQFTCTYNGAEVFRADLFPAISANPFISFFTVATESGVVAFN
jgi:sulfur-oxidizing protein SoxY